MARYVDVDKLIEKYERCIADKYNRSVAPISWAAACEDAKYELENAPTADVREVKHGKWIWVDGDLGCDDYKCSMCSENIVIVGEEKLPNFCPNCGADMRKGKMQNDL